MKGSQWYWQVKMDEEIKLLTAFTVGPLGFYECNWIPFGLTNAPATFQQLMETCLRDLNLNWCIIYLDNIVIFSKNPASHLVRLEAMFQKLELDGLKLKPCKCKLFHRQITYLGHIVCPGSRDQWGKDRCHQNLAHSHHCYWSLMFSGICGILLPVHPKVCTSSPTPAWADVWWKHRQEEGYSCWNDRWQQVFDELKCLCTMVPILAYANFVSLLNCIPMLVGLVWGLSSIRLMMMVLMLS